jgi:hypothetical protein
MPKAKKVENVRDALEKLSKMTKRCILDTALGKHWKFQFADTAVELLEQAEGPGLTEHLSLDNDTGYNVFDVRTILENQQVRKILSGILLMIRARRETKGVKIRLIRDITLEASLFINEDGNVLVKVK